MFESLFCLYLMRVGAMSMPSLDFDSAYKNVHPPRHFWKIDVPRLIQRHSGGTYSYSKVISKREI